MDSTTRPVHLDLTKMKFPAMAIISIMHRISGVLLFLLLPLALYLLDHSLRSQQSFDALQHMLHLPTMIVLVWILIAAVCFHFLAGIRHMLMDCGLAESLSAARFSAYVVMGLEVIAIIFSGVWLWS